MYEKQGTWLAMRTTKPTALIPEWLHSRHFLRVTKKKNQARKDVRYGSTCFVIPVPRRLWIVARLTSCKRGPNRGVIAGLVKSVLTMALQCRAQKEMTGKASV